MLFDLTPLVPRQNRTVYPPEQFGRSKGGPSRRPGRGNSGSSSRRRNSLRGSWTAPDRLPGFPCPSVCSLLLLPQLYTAVTALAKESAKRKQSARPIVHKNLRLSAPRGGRGFAACAAPAPLQPSPGAALVGSAPYSGVSDPCPLGTAPGPKRARCRQRVPRDP